MTWSESRWNCNGEVRAQSRRLRVPSKCKRVLSLSPTPRAAGLPAKPSSRSLSWLGGLSLDPAVAAPPVTAPQKAQWQPVQPTPLRRYRQARLPGDGSQRPRPLQWGFQGPFPGSGCHPMGWSVDIFGGEPGPWLFSLGLVCCVPGQDQAWKQKKRSPGTPPTLPRSLSTASRRGTTRSVQCSLTKILCP